MISQYCDMDTSSELQYKTFEWLRFPLIVGVVFIHSFGSPFDYDSLDFTNLSGLDYYNLFRVSISHVLTHICVPTFFFISGFLFYRGLEDWNHNTYFQKLRKRVKSLLVPFLIWNTISIVLPLAGVFMHDGWLGIQNFFQEHNYWHLYWDCKQWNLDRTNWLGGADFASSPYLVPLWFLRDLMVVVLCSPILYLLLKKLKMVGLFLLAVCYVTGVFIHIPGVSTTAFFFFGMGGYCKIHEIDVTQITHRYRYLSYTIAFTLWITCTLLDGHNTSMGNVIYPFYVLFGFFALISLSSVIVKNDIIQIPPFLSNSSFFIYLSHTILITPLVSKAVNSIFGLSNPMLMTIGYLVKPVVIALICLSFYYILNRFLPSICRALTGGR